MCNCGKKRVELKQQQNIYTSPVNLIHHTQSISTVLFKYIGNTALSVTGSNTRKNYRFNFPGDTQAVALNDAPAMSMIKVLKRID